MKRYYVTNKCNINNELSLFTNQTGKTLKKKKSVTCTGGQGRKNIAHSSSECNFTWVNRFRGKVSSVSEIPLLGIHSKKKTLAINVKKVVQGRQIHVCFCLFKKFKIK